MKRTYTFNVNYRLAAQFITINVEAGDIETALGLAEDVAKEIQPEFESPEDAPRPSIEIDTVNVVAE
jgi:hypothetical protein